MVMHPNQNGNRTSCDGVIKKGSDDKWHATWDPPRPDNNQSLLFPSTIPQLFFFALLYIAIKSSLFTDCKYWKISSINGKAWLISITVTMMTRSDIQRLLDLALPSFRARSSLSLTVTRSLGFPRTGPTWTLTKQSLVTPGFFGLNYVNIVCICVFGLGL